METSTSMNVFEALNAAMKKVSAIGKDRKNTMQGFQYRGIDDVMNELHGIFSEVGVFVVPEVLEQTREERKNSKGTTLIYSILKTRITFYAVDGTYVSAVVIGEGMDSGDKASNKALSVALKYALLQVLCIPTEEMKDPDAESHEVQPKGTAIKKAQKSASAQSAFKGGEDTQEERYMIGKLLDAIGDASLYDKVGEWRKARTAGECIDYLKQMLSERSHATSGNEGGENGSKD